MWYGKDTLYDGRICGGGVVEWLNRGCTGVHVRTEVDLGKKEEALLYFHALSPAFKYD